MRSTSRVRARKRCRGLAIMHMTQAVIGPHCGSAIVLDTTASALKRTAPHQRIGLAGARTIRALWNGGRGMTQTAIAQLFGTSQPYVSKICRGEVWREPRARSG